MDRKHQLDAPDNESLRGISQLEDHSGLTTLYPQAHNQWDGTLMSSDERESKRDQELSSITSTITRWAVPIGLLAVAPIVSAALLVTIAYTFVNEDNASLLLFPMMLITGVWGIVSLAAIKRLYGIFYAHAIRATPFFIILLVLMGLATQSLIILSASFQSSSLITTVALVCAFALISSVALSWILLHIWTTRRVSGSAKMWLIGGMALGLLALATIATLL